MGLYNKTHYFQNVKASLLLVNVDTWDCFFWVK